MTVISLTKLYDLLAAKIGKETAENLTTFIEHKIKEEVENKSDLLAIKEDIFFLKQDVAKLETKISEAKVDSIKWSIALWVTAILMIAGLYLKK
jgi:hypothetical protein